MHAKKGWYEKKIILVDKQSDTDIKSNISEIQMAMGNCYIWKHTFWIFLKARSKEDSKKPSTTIMKFECMIKKIIFKDCILHTEKIP